MSLDDLISADAASFFDTDAFAFAVVYRRGSDGAPVPTRCVAGQTAQDTQTIDDGDRVMQREAEFELPSADVEAPAPGDTITIDASANARMAGTWVVVEVQGEDAAAWTLRARMYVPIESAGLGYEVD